MRVAGRVLFVGGGTGGHLAPAVGLAEELEERGHRTCFHLGGRPVERLFVSGHEVLGLGIEMGRLPRPLALARAWPRARGKARRFAADVVVGLGGLAGSAALAGLGRRPLVLLEGNRHPGRGIRLLARRAACTLTQYRETAGELPRGRWIGPVSRRALARRGRQEARRIWGLPPAGPVLLVLGGSQGARDLNLLAAALAPALARAGVALLAAAGPGKAAPLAAACEAAGLPARVEEHLADMGAAFAAADLALTRGGAATLGELWMARLPALVVPYPHHRDRQQEHNARALEPGVELRADCGPATRRRLLELLADATARNAMREALVRSDPGDGRRRAADLVEALLGGSSLPGADEAVAGQGEAATGC